MCRFARHFNSLFLLSEVSRFARLTLTRPAGPTNPDPDSDFASVASPSSPHRRHAAICHALALSNTDTQGIFGTATLQFYDCDETISEEILANLLSN